MKLYVATHNMGKQKEIQQFLQDTSFTLIFPNEDHQPPEETASTFIENALIKAHHGCRVSGLPTLADDTGLVVAALNGEPGILSARYSSDRRNPQANTQKVLEKLQGVENRSAYFSCVIVMLRNEKDPNPIIAEGIWPGTILHEPRGEQGFGYDSIFQAEGTKQSAAELALTVKNQLSHRAQALQQLKQFF